MSRLELMEMLKSRYESGDSIRTLSRELGHSYGLVRDLLLEAGVRLRSRGGPNRVKKGHYVNGEWR